MKAVPEPPITSRHDKYAPIWNQIINIAGDKAVCLVFSDPKQAMYVRGKFRKKAKEMARFLSSSHSSDALTWYFWLEPKAGK